MRFRTVVAAELERRQRGNPRYSLRGFARSLCMHHSTLSRLLSGTQPIHAATISSLGTRLGLTRDRIRDFIAREDVELVREAIARPAFRAESRWLASIAGISVDRVNMAIHTLLRRGHLQMLSTARWSVARPEGAE